MLSMFGRVFRARETVTVPGAEKPLMRALEPRVLLDAAALETALDASDAADVAFEPVALAAQPGARDLSRDVVFIDAGVADIGTILSDIDPAVEVHVLDTGRDGVAQMAAVLDGRQDVAAVHVFSHGDAGVLALGSGRLTGESITGRHVADLQRIGAALSADGDILLYGCDFAEGEAGLAAIRSLSLATGADVAASNDLTGNADRGGDWDLEVQAGTVEAQSFELERYDHTFAAFELGTVNAPQVFFLDADGNPVAPTDYGNQEVGQVGTVAVWEDAGTVRDANGDTVVVDVVATVEAVSGDFMYAGFGTRAVDAGGSDPTLDDFRVQIHNSTSTGGSNTGTVGFVDIRWEIRVADGSSTMNGNDPSTLVLGERTDIGNVTFTTSDIDGTGADDNAVTRERLSASTATLSSYTVQDGTNLNVTNDGAYVNATGTANQFDEESSWVGYTWNSVNFLDMRYTTRTPERLFQPRRRRRPRLRQPAHLLRHGRRPRRQLLLARLRRRLRDALSHQRLHARHASRHRRR